MPEERSPRYVPPKDDFWKVFNLTEGQDRIMLLTFLHLAARRSELFRLKWSDVDFENSRVRLWTRKRKGGALESDWLPMTDELNQALAGWKEEIPIKGNYVVVPQPNSATIAADKMNVVYRGVENPMTISFSGVPDFQRRQLQLVILPPPSVKNA